MTGTIDELQSKTNEIALALGDEVSHADIGERIPEVWAATIEAEADRVRIIRQFSRVFTDLLGKPGDTLKIPKRAIIDYNLYPPTDISNDLTAIVPNVELTYRTVIVTPTEVGIGARITKQAIDEAMVSIINDALLEMARGVAQKEDIDGIIAITALDADPVHQVTYVEANQSSTTYVSGKWAAAVAGALSTGVLGGTWSGHQANLTDGDIIDLGVISEAQDVILPTQGFTADTIIMHPKQIADLKRNPQFLEASRAGDNSVFKTGLVGNFFGLNVYISRNLPKLECAADGLTPGYQAIMLDSTAALALVIKRAVTVETKYEPAERMHYIFITSMYKFKRVNDGAVVLINTT
jgi:hypothetical protein